MHSKFKEYLLQTTNSSSCKEVEVIQTLWSGYGKISRYQLSDSTLRTVVVKYISPGLSGGHPRGWNTNFSHQRKVKSYEVETVWYENWSQHCSEKCRVPVFLGAFSDGQERWIILEDLTPEFPLRKNLISIQEVKVCLTWLANFHAVFIRTKPLGLWDVGTYWHLHTRPDELKKMEHSSLKLNAKAIDEVLNNCLYQTIVHGDAKLANFCFAENGIQVAAVDFQYVGRGCGMKDVAYFLGSCLSSTECKEYEDELLAYYFSVLHRSIKDIGQEIDCIELEKEWREMYPFVCADFTRFLLGWMPSHQKVNEYHLNMVDTVLRALDNKE